MSAHKPIVPGATLGILGGGQLGRMTAMTARTMGYHVHVLDPDPLCPASYVVDKIITAAWNDADAAAQLARECDVVTLEIEQISVDSLLAAEKFAPVRPAPEMVRTIQDRILQREWLQKHGFPQTRYRTVRSLADLQQAVHEIGPRLFVKSARGGYDGRSQAKLGFDGAATAEQIAAAWQSLQQRPSVAEQAQDLVMELSVMVARSPQGEMKTFPPATNHHENQILAWSVIPLLIPAAIAKDVDATKLEQDARELALAIAEKFELEGLLCVEMFLNTNGKMLVNELAPRPHNSYHQSERGCATSQFEQLVRAVCNLPLGATEIVTPAAIVNLLGDVWLNAPSGQPDWAAALAVPGVRIHLYEKQTAKSPRKMGHLSGVGTDPAHVVAAVQHSKRLL